MVQAKISSFFKTQNESPQISSEIPKNTGEILITYKRREPKVDHDSDDDKSESENINTEIENVDASNTSSGSSSTIKTSNKKRSYSQFHLQFGQSNFLFHTCSFCGLMYAKGDPGDEEMHKSYHKDYYQGVKFKGWRNERVVFTRKSNEDRIVLVLDDDSPAHKDKVRQVVEIMEKELVGFCDGKLLHNPCQVYLYISNHRIVGCLICEPIKEAYKLISDSTTDCKLGTEVKSPPSLQFGNITFRREIVRKENSANRLRLNELANGAILCEEGAVNAVCGIRAIWVAPSRRRNQVASKLLDTAREKFCSSHELRVSECAFSAPTSAGKAFALSYCGSHSFLIYKTQNV